MAKDAKPYRLRIPPTSPREKHVYPGGATFERALRWYPIGEEEKARYAKAVLYDTNPSSPPLFQIVTPERALEIDQEEGVLGAAAEREALEREAKIVRELEQFRAENAVLASRLGAFGEVLGMLVPGGLPAELAQRLGLPDLATKPKDDKGETAGEKPGAKAEEERAARPARPGDRKVDPDKAPKTVPKDKGEKADDKGEKAKPVRGVDGDADDPLGSGKAVEAHDDALRSGGGTPNR